MSDWQERITVETAPAIRVEHDLRYLLAAPLILRAGGWADLGCGNGLAAASALGAERPRNVVLVDVEETAVERAAEELGLPQAIRIAGDLTDPADLERIGAAVLAFGGDAVITCFEVVEHLRTFLPLLEWATAMAGEAGTTFLLSVPNDAFWSIQNPHHLTAWGEGAFEELAGLLPDERSTFWQVALSGSAIVDPDASPEQRQLAVETGGAGTVPTHFLVAFGPGHRELTRPTGAVQSDMLEQRRWERQRENDLVLIEEVAREQRDELRERNVWFEEWRTYIHELERELKRPLSGTAADELPQAGASGDVPPGTA